MKHITQLEIVREYFNRNPNREIPHPEVVDWAVAEYRHRTKRTLRDPDRMIRELHQQGWLIKVKNGVYKYDPNAVTQTTVEHFTQNDKNAILKRDGHRCVVCGKSEADGVELHVDHIKPKDKGGEADISNGQTLCAEHNFKKKNYDQTELGKRLFIRLHQRAKQIHDEQTMEFCTDVLAVYEQHDIDNHIQWSK